MLYIAPWLTWKRQDQTHVSFILPSWSVFSKLTCDRSAVIQSFLAERAADSNAPKVAFFYCSASDDQRTLTSQILGSIARQLSWNGLDESPETAFLDAYGEKEKEKRERNADKVEPLDVKDLIELIPKLVGHGTAVLLIDALDECAEKAIFLTAMETIQAKAEIKLILSGRNEVRQDIPEAADGSIKHIHAGEGANEDSIRKYVIAEVERVIVHKQLLRGMVSDGLKTTIIQELNDSAQGMYVAATLRPSPLVILLT
jgi:hypothetical protein